ncbi:MAG TPA: hypothetical protein VEL74_22120 [Thermoanaerobaculia bacterium]|nr:hypothetical protein [Thermoanaerobaculia bacterium]
MSGNRGGDHNTFLQDLLSNALAAVIVLTLVVLAISSAAGEQAQTRQRERERSRVQPVRGFRMDQARVDRRDDTLSALLLQLEVQGAGKTPDLQLAGGIAPYGPAGEVMHWRGGEDARHHLFVIPAAPESGGPREWQVRMDGASGPVSLRWRVVADEVVLLAGEQEIEPHGGGPEAVLAVCLGVADEVAVVPAGWNAPTACQGGV